MKEQDKSFVPCSQGISIIADIIFSSIYLSFIIITNFMTVVNVIITFYYY